MTGNQTEQTRASDGRRAYTSPYTAAINRITGGLCDARHVEAYMRVEHPTLDGLDAARFRREVQCAMECVAVGGLDAAERLAQSYGMRAS